MEELHKRTSYVSLRTLETMIRNSSVKGIDVSITPKDVSNYAKYVHKATCACTFGKMQHAPAPVLNLSHHEPTICHCDVMHITTDDKVKQIFLVGVDARTQYVFAFRITTESAEETINALRQIISVYNKSNQVVTGFRMDNCRANHREKIETEFAANRISVQFCTSGSHVRIAEVAIKMLKSLARTTVVDFATSRRFTTQFIPYLITWITESLNFALRSSNNYVSPYQLFTGKLVQVDKHFRVNFLEIVAVHDLTKNVTNLNSRAKIGLVVGREQSYNGGLLVLNIENKQILKRYDFEVLNSPEIYKMVNDKFLDTIVIPEKIISIES